MICARCEHDEAFHNHSASGRFCTHRDCICPRFTETTPAFKPGGPTTVSLLPGGPPVDGPDAASVAEYESRTRSPRRLRACVEQWPDCEDGAYHPRCCRFPKQCSCRCYATAHVTDADLEPAARFFGGELSEWIV